MNDNGERRTAIEGLVAEILEGARHLKHRAIKAWQTPTKDIERLARRDYVRALRRQLSYGEILRVLDNAQRVWPNLNKVQFNIATRRQFERRAHELTADLDVHLQASPYEGPEGMALRGFYVERRRRMLKRPIIYVNTAHQPGAVSSTFCHELGHHLTSKLFGAHREGVHFFFDADYAEHLSDPIELAADVLVSLAGYPEDRARELFSVPWDWGLVARTGRLSPEVFGKVRKHAEAHLGIDFGADWPAHQRLNYLAGMIHYAKLRWALLAEYDL
ncbi:MAG TPA: hypothetical protein VMV27_06450 [Candidatus Binataceae bacterium]|nr:hypothetical protein [Candidatus Binataceae bacterium]